MVEGSSWRVTVGGMLFLDSRVRWAWLFGINKKHGPEDISRGLFTLRLDVSCGANDRFG